MPNLGFPMGGGLVDSQERFYNVATHTANSVPEILRHDPTTSAWSKVAAMPAAGSLQGVTSVGTKGSGAIWFLASAQGSMNFTDMKSIVDAINAIYGRDSLFFAVQGSTRPWKMRQSQLSSRFTTPWGEILTIS